MQHIENWIWLPKDKYPNDQNTVFSGFNSQKAENYTVAELEREYVFESKIIRAELRFSGDTAFQLFCNDSFIATGPACVGGDFIGNDRVRDNFYSFEKCIEPCSNRLKFYALVKLLPVQICEYSKGQGGFMLSAILTFEDGTETVICTDESWMIRKNGRYTSPRSYDGRILPDRYVNAECVSDIWRTSVAPIPVREEHELFGENSRITLLPHEEKEVVIELDRIWGGFVHVKVKTDGELSIKLFCREINDGGSCEELIFADDDEYRGFYMHSAGNIRALLKSDSDTSSEVEITFIETHYPISEECETRTSDKELNAVLDTCKHTLKICRQTHHLDSPRHCEPMACTGDYYIETLMTMFSFGDMRLSEFDLVRTAAMLERENGRMFHTTYSLIWVRMLYDVYMASGHIELLKKCEKGLRLLLDRFETYIGENGIIENPPDYMFIDWIYIDGISMHHPPKALGQSCLNMFYFSALDSAEKIFELLSYSDDAKKCAEKKSALRKAVNDILFDSEKRIYFEGLNTPTDESLIGEWMPQNVEKRYYLKHSNILAVCFGICDDELGREIVKKVFSGEIEGDCQPYFMHYLFEAVYRLGLRDEYTLKLAELWKKHISECPKGLVEGFVKPEPTYSFDHSHAWGGTPLYSLPKALMGLDIIEPGMKKLSVSPSLLGLEYAEAELITPYGKVSCRMKRGEAPVIEHPDEVEVIIR